MPRRKSTHTPLLAPAGNLIRKLSDTDIRLRRKIMRYGLSFLTLAFLYSTMVGTYSLPRIVRLELARSRLIESNLKRRAELVDLEMTRNRLLTDRAFIEMIARTRYHLVGKGETIYRYRGQ
ncbi:MAG: septum formation initiator family protein [candidate division Zixibacteria bacterium]